MVAFHDAKLIYPEVTALVYLGTDVLGGEKETTWYFQDTASYAEHGSFAEGRSTNGRILTFVEAQLEDVLDVSALGELLASAERGTATKG